MSNDLKKAKMSVFQSSQSEAERELFALTLSPCGMPSVLDRAFKGVL